MLDKEQTKEAASTSNYTTDLTSNFPPPESNSVEEKRSDFLNYGSE